MLWVCLILVNVQLLVKVSAFHLQPTVKCFFPPPLPGPHAASVKEKKCLTEEGMFQLCLSFTVYNLHLLCDCRDLGTGNSWDK